MAPSYPGRPPAGFASRSRAGRPVSDGTGRFVTPCNHEEVGRFRPCRRDRRRAASRTRSVTVVDDDLARLVLSPVVTPNPFGSETSVQFGVQRRGPVSISIHDVQGRLVRTLLPTTILEASTRDVRWDGRDDRGDSVGSGVYLCRVQTSSRVATMRIVHVRTR